METFPDVIVEVTSQFSETKVVELIPMCKIKGGKERRTDGGGGVLLAPGAVGALNNICLNCGGTVTRRP
jgi:hypothetical protein